MSLRLKMELLLIAVVGSVVALGYFFQQQVILPRFIPHEQEQAAEEMQRCLELITSEFDSLNALCRDWVQRDETLRLIEGSRKDARSKDLPSLRNYGLNFVCAVSATGEVILHETMDFQTGKPIEIPDFPTDVWPADHVLLQHPSPDEGRAGVYMSDAGPLLLATWPIVSWDAESVKGGTLVAGKMLDKYLLWEISGHTNVLLRAWPVQGNHIPSADAEAAALASVGHDPVVRESSSEMLQVYASFPDMFGNPALLFRADLPRGYFPILEDALQQSVIVQLIIFLLGFVVIAVALRSLVLSPLMRLTEHASAIRTTQDLSTRINLHRQDEIGVLAREFNAMIEMLSDDIAARKATEEELRESKERFTLAVQGSSEGIWDWDLKTDKLYLSPRWKSMLGYEEDEIGDTPDSWFNLVHPEDLPTTKASLQTHLEGRSDHFESEYRVVHRDTTFRWMLSRGVAVRNENGEATRIAGSQSDITSRKTAEEQLSHKALHDSLTGLPNRALLLDRLGQTIRFTARRDDYRFALMFMDLDRFKVINDSLGHAVGDQLLMLFAKKLNDTLRNSDTVSRFSGTVARLGGDEFVALLEDLGEDEDVDRVAARLQKALEEPFKIGEHEIFTSVSIGIAISGRTYESPEDFLRNADTAMYHAKRKGRARHVVFDDSMREQAMGRMRVETDLRHALERDEFRIHYQPIISLTHGKITAFEALVRWEHPERGLVSPSEFVPIAEEMGLITSIGRWVMEEACSQTVRWQDQFKNFNNLSISVNVSVKQFSDPNLFESITDVLDRTGIDPELLKLEITESVIMENVGVVTETLKKLRDLKVKLSLDDFGTGYSSLSYLHQFPMHILKIDQSFIRNVMASEENLALVRTIIMMAKNFGMTAIAEGLEKEEQIAELKRLGCEEGQGYFYSKPLPPKMAAELLSSDPSW